MRHVQAIGDHIAANRERRVRERPANDGNAEPGRAQDGPERPRAERGRRLRSFAEQSGGDESVSEAVVRQHLERRTRGPHVVEGCGPHPRAHRQLACGNRRQHRCGLRRPQRRQVHHRAAVQDAREIRQPPIGDRRRDEIERRSVEEQHRHASVRRRRERDAVLDAAGSRGRLVRRAAQPQRQCERREQHQPEGRGAGPPTASEREPEHAEREQQCHAERQDDRAERHPTCGFVVERGTQAVQVQPHQRGSKPRRDETEPHQQLEAHPPG